MDADGDGLGDNQSGTDADYLDDADNDGYNDSVDLLPNFASPGDLDADGCPDDEDVFPSDASECTDFDQDGVGDNGDTDDDNDGWSDTDEIRLGADALNQPRFPLSPSKWSYRAPPSASVHGTSSASSEGDRSLFGCIFGFLTWGEVERSDSRSVYAWRPPEEGWRRLPPIGNMR